MKLAILSGRQVIQMRKMRAMQLYISIATGNDCIPPLMTQVGERNLRFDRYPRMLDFEIRTC
jgi:hypothetical protein